MTEIKLTEEEQEQLSNIIGEFIGESLNTKIEEDIASDNEETEDEAMCVQCGELQTIAMVNDVIANTLEQEGQLAVNTVDNLVKLSQVKLQAYQCLDLANKLV